MRKAQKQQAEEFAKLLDRAHNEIRKAIDRKDPGTARVRRALLSWEI